MSKRSLALLFFCLTSGCPTLPAQLQERGRSDDIRVTVAVNEDGSHTSYEFDQANHKATATNTSPNGKLLSKIRYDLDDAGKFSAGEIFGPDGKLRFKTRYKYDGSGRLSEETHLSKDDVVQNRLVYSYDMIGKQTGYIVYDASGKVIGQTAPSKPNPPSRKR